MSQRQLLRDVVQAIMGLSLIWACIYLAVVGRLPIEFFCTLVGYAVGFFLAERKNGKEMNHIEKLRKET